MVQLLDSDLEDHSKDIALPSRMAMAASKEITGYQWEPAPHLLKWEEVILDAVLDPRQRFVRLNAPPRYGKSQYVSLFLPAWVLGMFPDKTVILVTYSDDFAAEWGRGVRDLLKLYGRKMFNRTISKESQSAAFWHMERSFGGMAAVGVGGSLTGRGGWVIIIDDLIKNIQEANSVATKKMHVEWYDSTLRTRLEPGGTIIMMSTRWAEDDLTGILEEREEKGSPEKWERLVFPALAECPKGENPDIWTDMLGRKEGDPLWPSRWPLDGLLDLKGSMDPILWEALYQQNPVPRQGGMFPREGWRYFPLVELDEMADKCRAKVRVWDLAASQDQGDWTVGVLMGINPQNHFCVLDVQRFRKDPAGTERSIIATAERDGLKVPIVIEQERSGAGSIVVDNYKRVLPRWNVTGRKPVGTKEQRAGVYAGKVGAGLVWLPSGAPWVDDYVTEHQKFPRSRWDDQVDTSVYAFDELADQAMGSSIWIPGENFNFSAEDQMRALLHQG